MSLRATEIRRILTLRDLPANVWYQAHFRHQVDGMCLPSQERSLAAERRATDVRAFNLPLQIAEAGVLAAGSLKSPPPKNSASSMTRLPVANNSQKTAREPAEQQLRP
jgi:hypothetical protein